MNRKSEIDPRFFTDLGIVTRIDDGDVNEVSNVDDPATAIDFAMFKALKDIQDAPGLADVEACLRENIATPTECESREEGYGDLLRADVRSHEDSGSPPARTEAIKGETMGRKIEALAGPVPDAPPPDGGGAPADGGGGGGGGPIEIPGTPVDFSLPDCIQAGLDAGFDEDQSGQICLVMRDQYGAAGEAGMLLLPEGVTPEGVMAATAEALGFATITGKAAKPAKIKAPDPKTYRGIGSYWQRITNGILGRKSEAERPGVALARYLKTLKEDLMSENMKTREDLWRAMQMQDRAHARTSRLLAAALNVALPEEEEDDAAASPEPVAAEPEATPANPLIADGKRRKAKAVKCGADGMPVAPSPEAKAEAPVAPTDTERLNRLEGLVEQLIQTVTAGGAGIPLEDDLGDEIDQEEDAAVIEESLAAAGGVPGKRAPLANALAARMAQQKATTIAALRRPSIPAGYSRGSVTGMVIADADLAATSAGRGGVKGLHIKR